MCLTSQQSVLPKLIEKQAAMTYFEASSSMENGFDDNSNDEDFLIALQLQNQFDNEEKENEGQLNKITQVFNVTNCKNSVEFILRIFT